MVKFLKGLPLTPPRVSLWPTATGYFSPVASNNSLKVIILFKLLGSGTLRFITLPNSPTDLYTSSNKPDFAPSSAKVFLFHSLLTHFSVSGFLYLNWTLLESIILRPFSSLGKSSHLIGFPLLSKSLIKEFLPFPIRWFPS